MPCSHLYRRRGVINEVLLHVEVLRRVVLVCVCICVKGIRVRWSHIVMSNAGGSVRMAIGITRRVCVHVRLRRGRLVRVQIICRCDVVAKNDFLPAISACFQTNPFVSGIASLRDGVQQQRQPSAMCHECNVLLEQIHRPLVTPITSVDAYLIKPSTNTVVGMFVVVCF